ncbi:MAG: universal stress protein [Sphaerobacter sp.]|nr:universal stress protein [Sphaerobacter sp.]
MSRSPARVDDAACPIVLVALDGSPAAATALPIAAAVARQIGGRLGVLHVAARAVSAPDIARALGLTGPDWESIPVRVEVGDPVERILRATEDPDVALLVLTTHGREITSGERLGSVARRIVARAMRPILLVRPGPAAGKEAIAAEIRRIMIPVDGSEVTLRALGPVLALAGRLGAEIDILYVVEPGRAPRRERGGMTLPRYVDQPQHEWPEWAREVVDHLCACAGQCVPGRHPRVFLARGEASDQIARVAAARQVDALVLVRSSRLEPGHGRVLLSLLTSGPCPALLVGANLPVAEPTAAPERAEAAADA